MMGDTPGSQAGSHLSINPPPPSFAPANPDFTPRSSSFPDNDLSSDEDVFDPTPIHSPSGPHYDDLPPSYDEAQQAALRDARNGIPPLNPNHLEMNHMSLDERDANVPQYEIPANAEVHAHRASAEEIAREERRNGGVSVPVQHVRSSESVPVGRVTPTAPVDQAAVLLSTALQFTSHEPDADTRYAPRLTRCVAIPQDVVASGRKGKVRREVRRSGRGRGGRDEAHVPGAWPGASSETLPTNISTAEEPAQFLRAYAKALHAHSIRPAEFLDFLDGLNALCVATTCTPADLVRPDENASSDNAGVVKKYIRATNETFFAPRGLKVSLKSLASLLEAISVPEERGQRAGAIASVLDPKSSPAKRAQALQPWIASLETSVSEPSVATLTLREMAERFRTSPPTFPSITPNDNPQAPESEKTRLERDYAERDRPTQDEGDPPHSIPGEFPQTSELPHPRFRNWRGRGAGRGAGPWTPFGAPGHGPFGPPGSTPFGPPAHALHGSPGFTPFSPPGHGPHGPPGFRSTPWGSRSRPCGGPGASGSGWEALGQSIGKWGEDFGKKMEAWGDQFARDAASWGDDVGRRAAGGGGYGAAGPSAQRAPGASSSSSVPLAAGSAGASDAQETGVHPETQSGTHGHVAVEHEDKAGMKAARKHNEDYDDDSSSISSDSSSDSDSEDEDDGEDDDKEYAKASTIFADRIREINTAADASRAKGKKSPADIERERGLAIEKAAKDKAALEDKIQQKRTKRAVMRDFRNQRRDLNRERGQTKRDLKKQGLGKKSKEWKEAKKRHREKKKALRREKNCVRRQFREARKVERGERREKTTTGGHDDAGDSVWIVIENLAE